MAITEEIRRVVPKGAVIFHEGEPGNCAYVIERGDVEITTRRGGEKVVIARRSAGEIFGEMAIVDNRPRSATVAATSDCELLILSASQLQDRLRTLDPVLRMVLTVILDRFRDTMARFKSEALETLVPDLDGSSSDPKTRLLAHKEAIERIELEQSLKKALAREELELYFQPIVSCRTGRIASFESLLRWQHPTQGLILPGAFIAAAEQSGLICDVSHFVVEKACESLKQLRQGLPGGVAEGCDLSISVNISAREFANEDFVDRIEDTLRHHDVRPCNLTLEITESMLIENPDRTLEILERCRGIGLSISIDDFGTGYSSLSYLHRFPFETLKIDRSFMAELNSAGGGQEIVRTMISLGHGLNMKVVAEGVEETEQATTLQLLGCDYLQGYLFSRPIPLKAAREMLGSWQGFDAEVPMLETSPFRQVAG